MKCIQNGTDAEKKQFMQAFIERIDIFPKRRKDGNCIQKVKVGIKIRVPVALFCQFSNRVNLYKKVGVPVFSNGVDFFDEID